MCPVSLKFSFDTSLHCIKVNLNVWEAMATHSHYYRGASRRKIKGVPYSFPMPREVGEQEAIKQKISIIHFSISCPSSSNKMESLKKSVQRAPYIINLVSLGCKLLYNRKSVFFLPMFWIVSCILTSQILNQSSLGTKSIQKIVLFLLFFFHNIQGLSVSRWR